MGIDTIRYRSQLSIDIETTANSSAAVCNRVKVVVLPSMESLRGSILGLNDAVK